MKCVNCGADVSGSKCEYCGTWYGKKKAEAKPEEPEFHITGRTGTINLFGEEIRTYISDASIESVDEIPTCGRDIEGNIIHVAMKPKRKFAFTLIEI